MAALPNVPGVLRLQMKHTVAEDVDAIVHLYFTYTGAAPSSASLATMAGTVRAAWNTGIKAFASTQVKLTEVIVTDLTSPSSGVGIDSTSVTGTKSGLANAGAVALLVNYKIARRYRGGKPRSYLPYFAAGDMDDQQTWTAATVASFLTAWNTYVGAIIAAAPGGATITGQVNVSYYEGFTSVQNPVTLRWRNVNTVRVAPVVDAVVGTSVNPRPATIRRRSLQK